MTKEAINRLIAELESQLKNLEAKRTGILEKLEGLRHRQKEFPADESASGLKVEEVISKVSSVSQKIVLFRSLFKGRENVYARRWESLRTGKSGYQPMCKNDWIRGVCRKPEIKCGECVAREFLPLTDNVIQHHLFGFDPAVQAARRATKDFVIGIFPLLQDDTCWFLAADFDKESWKLDISALRDTSCRFDVPLAVERSRSGSGAHIWIFFSESVPAILARKLGSFLLTETLDQRPEIGLSSYDRLFPNQDTLPYGGFGNLIALPLQFREVEKGNSVFVDGNIIPFSDQWAYLESVRKMSRTEIDKIVEEANRRKKIIGIRLPITDETEKEPWSTPPSRRRKEIDISGPMPDKVKIVLGDLIYVEREGLPAVLQSRLMRLASFQNPKFFKAQAMRLSTYGKPRIISCVEDFGKYLGLPRGCLEEVVEMLNSLKIDVNIKDERYSGNHIEAQFQGALRYEQEAAVKALLEFDTGVLAAATAFGKTVVSAKMIAERSVNTLVLVHRRQLLDQWTVQLKEFL